MGSSNKCNRFIGLLSALVSIVLLQQQIAGAADYPCDIYEEAGVPCIAAYSTVRLLNSTYEGPLYQVRRSSDQQTQDISFLESGFANSKEQDDFLGGGKGTVSRIYDQSGKDNDLTVAKKGCYTGSAGEDDYEANAKGKKLKVNGHDVYALYMEAHGGYRTNQEGYSGYPAVVQAANGAPKGNDDQGIYEVVDGKRYGTACCWNFGNGSTNNCYGPTGQMNTLFFGTAYWGRGAGNGPWFMNDMEAGVWAGGGKPGEPGWGALEGDHPPNPNNPSINWDYAFGISKTSTENNQPKYCIRTADALQGGIKTAWDGNAPESWKMEGGIILGIGGDNSNSSWGTFYEGCITAGRPSDETDDLILKNVQNQNYGSNVVAIASSRSGKALPSMAQFNVNYNSSNVSAVISYTLKSAQRVSMNIFDQRGKQISTISKGMVSAGRRYEHVWDTKQKSSGIYFVRINLDGRNTYTEKVIVRK